MSWSIGYDENWKRDIGYGVPAYCDHPSCNQEIHRGLSYVCGLAPYGGDDGCGLFFCHSHQRAVGLCEHCTNNTGHCFVPKPDHPRWIDWKLTHHSWQQWRDENPDEVRSLMAQGDKT